MADKVCAGPQYTMVPRAAALALAVSCAIAVPMASAQAINTEAPATASTVRSSKPAILPAAEDPLAGFYPSVTIGAVNHSNVFATPDDEQDDWAVTVSPALVWRGDMGGRHAVYAEYRADYIGYQEFDDQNTLNQLLQAGVGLDLTERLDVNGRIGYADAYEARGTAGSRLLVDDPDLDPDRFNELFYEGQVVYGRRTNTLQLAGTVSHSEVRFKNNDQAGRDRDADALAAAVFWNVGTVTSLFVEGVWEEIDYIEPGAIDFDSDVTSYNVGLAWQPTEVTTGIVRVGQTDKDFKDPAQEDFSGATYEGRVRWEARPYSIIEAYAAKSVEESTSFESSFIESTIYGVSWNHDLTERWTVGAFGQWINDQFSEGREDDYSSYGVNLVYDMTSWLDVGAGWSRTERSSSLPEADYEDDVISFFVTARR